jgi:hypothetical protein
MPRASFDPARRSRFGSSDPTGGCPATEVELVLVAVLALALGLAIGSVLGARRTLALVMAGRSIRSGASRVASFMPATMPSRSVADILAGRLRLQLGATEYVLPVLARAPARRWLESLDARFASLAVDLESAGDDAAAILTRLVAEADAMYDMLLSYEAAASLPAPVLPSRAEIDETATDAQVLHAVLEVWRAVHPLVASVADATPSPATTSTSPAPPSSPPPPTDGFPATSNGA